MITKKTGVLRVVLLATLATTVLVAQNLVSTTIQQVTRVDCCEGRVGDVNMSGEDEPTIGDVSLLIDALFISLNPNLLACLAEADINQSGGAEPVFNDLTIGDISYLIDYLFVTGPSVGLAECIPTFNPCTNCHGGMDNNTGAPPFGLEGETLSIELAVGAHTAHLEGVTLSDGIACSECHVVPNAVSDPGHLDGDNIPEIIWGSQAGNQSVWDRTAETCNQVYCHGNFSGGNNNSPIWTGTDQALCGSCHDVGDNPALLGGQHDRHLSMGWVSCADCHASVADIATQIIGPENHVNGQVNIVFESGVGDFADGWCLNPACHSSAPWY